MLYTVIVLGFALYCFQTIWLTWQLLKSSKNAKTPSQPNSVALSPHVYTGPTAIQAFRWPTVTVQLPIYNEQHVIERLIDACAKLTYPVDKLQIQVLDDST